MWTAALRLLLLGCLAFRRRVGLGHGGGTTHEPDMLLDVIVEAAKG